MVTFLQTAGQVLITGLIPLAIGKDPVEREAGGRKRVVSSALLLRGKEKVGVNVSKGTQNDSFNLLQIRWVPLWTPP